MNLPPGTFTFYNNFDNCPHKAWHLYVIKDLPKTPQSPEQKWGIEVHTAMESRVRDDTPLPDKMKVAEPIALQIDTLKAHYPIRVEASLAMTEDGNPADYWKDPWLRGKLDFFLLANGERPAAWMLDWKTGKVREEPYELQVGALLVKAHMPEIENIVGNYFWFQEGRTGQRYDLNEHLRTHDRLRETRSRMEKYQREGDWPKKKNPLCGWCPVKACEHNRSK